MIYLFVGGPCDGNWYEVSGPDTYISIAEPALVHHGMVMSETAGTFRRELYHATPFKSDERLFTIYRHHTITIDRMVDKLIHGYRKP